LREIRKPRALRPGDRIALVAPASGFSADDLQAGCEELRGLGFEPTYDMAIFERGLFTAGSPQVRAEVLTKAWTDPSVAALLAVRGGYGSAELLPLLDPADFAAVPKPFIGYSDTTSLMMWLTLSCNVVTFHGPMIDRRLAGGPSRYDRATFLGALMHAAPLGRIPAPGLEALRPGEARGRLLGGTLTQLAASLGTPYAFDPPEGHILFLDEVGERPYRVHRMFTQLAQAGIIRRAAAIVFNELPGCGEPSGSPCGRDAAVALTSDFPGPVLFGLPSGHTEGATLTLPMGVTARVMAGDRPGLIIEEEAVV
jgi:muramoyltetrapeptide carboxypeptidase